MSGPLDAELWARVQESVPILCVDVVPFRRGETGLEVGLIRRTFADTADEVWCHVGGRVQHGETTDEALARHLRETFVLPDELTDLGTDPQPHHVMQWFPGDLRRGPTYGDDPRKHALSLCFALDLGAELTTRTGGEGTDVQWFSPTGLESADLWPGTQHLVTATLAGAALP
ncbi:DUF4916 domain-containing protein [Aeromicrobium alkaliterrae]|uniref:Nudix hydrolase domain-containing protein n=1 Tax=Aeromicrobium alkaliterrae TaxID=302168 RepID=A0ABP4W847_9ACTN